MMILDKSKNKVQLLQELAEMRRHLMELEILEYERDQMGVALQDSLERIERAKQEWEVTVDSLPQLICLLDQQGCIIRANRAIETWGLGRVASVKGQTVPKLFYSNLNGTPGILDAFLQYAWPRLLGGQSSQHEAEDKALKRYLHVQLYPISGQTGRQDQASDSFAILIVDDISERKQAERLKNEFLNNISQELQTPLNSIIGYSQLMLTGIAGDALPPEILEDAQAIYENGQLLLNRINEILDLAEKGGFSAHALAEHVVDMLGHNGTQLPGQRPKRVSRRPTGEYLLTTFGPIKRPRILIVDNYASDTRLMRRLFEACQRFEVIEAYSGQEALAAVGEETPDLIILELMLPDMGGEQLLEMLRDHDRTRNVPVIVVSDKEVDSILRARLVTLCNSIWPKSMLDRSSLLAHAETILLE